MAEQRADASKSAAQARTAKATGEDTLTSPVKPKPKKARTRAAGAKKLSLPERKLRDTQRNSGPLAVAQVGYFARCRATQATSCYVALFCLTAPLRLLGYAAEQ